jgi:CheY-like chemotaxis protein
MTRTLLLADDSNVIQGLIERGLAELEFELIASGNGDEAIEIAHSVRPDIVLADVGLPGRDGYQVCRAIKESPELSGIPVVLLAGAFDPFDPAKAQASGADHHITKPFEADTLIQRLNSLLAPDPAAETLHPQHPAALNFSEEPATATGMTHPAPLSEDCALADDLDLASDADLLEALPLPEDYLGGDVAPIGADALDSVGSLDDAFDFGTSSSESSETPSEDPELISFGSLAPLSSQATSDPRPQAPEFERSDPAPRQDPEVGLGRPGTVQSALHGSPEQVAQEAFAELPEAVIQLLVGRIEAIAWEVIPGMAESLIREEIRRMKADDK